MWLTLGQRTLRYETYVMPAPEENAAELYEHLLRRNERLVGAHFSIGIEDAVFLRGELGVGGARRGRARPGARHALRHGRADLPGPAADRLRQPLRLTRVRGVRVGGSGLPTSPRRTDPDTRPGGRRRGRNGETSGRIAVGTLGYRDRMIELVIVGGGNMGAALRRRAARRRRRRSVDARRDRGAAGAAPPAHRAVPRRQRHRGRAAVRRGRHRRQAAGRRRRGRRRPSPPGPRRLLSIAAGVSIATIEAAAGAVRRRRAGDAEHAGARRPGRVGDRRRLDGRRGRPGVGRAHPRCRRHRRARRRAPPRRRHRPHRVRPGLPVPRRRGA